MKRLFTLIVLLGLSLCLFAQHQELNEKPGLWKEKRNVSDSTSLLSLFRRGTVSGHFRYYFMATDNNKDLTDYYAHAAGGGIKLETGRYKNFQLGVSGSFVFNLASSNLAVPDEKTNQLNRYETGLFDIQDPANKTNIARLEELYIKYHYKNSSVTLGKQLINTPFINLQDGRMRPTETEGIWTEINQLKKIKMQAGYIYGISPRSTVKWFSTGRSIGIYPAGVNADGTKSGYAGNLASKGIILGGITFQYNKNLKWQLWNLYTPGIFNSALLQADYVHPLADQATLFGGVQLIRQDAVKDGGNPNVAKTYFKKGGTAFTFGGRIGWKNERWETSLNYNRITAQGRYLMPREWGRDPFYTFLPRERNEGLGDVQAVVAKVNYKIPSLRLSASLAAGYYDLPEVTNFAMNKYGLPSYHQLNTDLRYQFAGFLEGLETQLLFVYKGKSGNTYGQDKYVINKVDMSLWNLVFNYPF